MKIMNRMLGALALLVSIYTESLANSYDFTGVGSGIVTSGTIDLGPFSNNVGGLGLSGWEVTSITGQINGTAITGLNPNPAWPTSSVYAGVVFYDNGLLQGPPLGLDWNGWSFFYNPLGPIEVNLFNNGNNYEADFGVAGGVKILDTLIFTPHVDVPRPVPDGPGTLGLVGLAFTGLVVARRKVALKMA